MNEVPALAGTGAALQGIATLKARSLGVRPLQRQIRQAFAACREESSPLANFLLE